jgi:hypothetical protein
MIRTNYDPEADVLHVAFGPEAARYDNAQEVAPGVFVEFDAAATRLASKPSACATKPPQPSPCKRLWQPSRYAAPCPGGTGRPAGPGRWRANHALPESRP